MQLKSRIQKSRHGIFYLRIQKFGIDKRFSLNTRDPLRAAVAAHQLGAKIAQMDINKSKKGWTLKTSGGDIEITTDGTQQDSDNAIAALRVLDTSRQRVSDETLAALPDIVKLAMQQAAATTATTTASSSGLRSIALRDAITEYKPALAKSKQALKSKKMALSTLAGLAEKLGADFDLSKLDDEVIEQVWLESRLTEVAATTAKRDLSFIKKFMDWCSDKKRMYCPALTLQFTARGEHWSYFERADLNAIFSKLSEHATKPWHFWLPVLGLYTGARIGELAALKPEYFTVKSGINMMHLQGTKTDASIRDIPIHANLIALGLLEFVATRHSQEMLFQITRSRQNGWGASATKWFTEHKKRCGVLDDKKVFHSFRHTIIDLMNQASVGDKAQCQYTGHAHGKDVHSAVYGRGKLSIQVMQEQVTNKIDFKQYCGFDIFAQKFT